MRFLMAFLMLASVAEAQEFYSYGTSPTIYTRSWGYSVSTFGPYSGYGYGGGYGYFPTPRWQMYQQPQRYYPSYWGTIPGYQTNGYFIPNWTPGW